MVDIAVCDRMKVNWLELQDIPGIIVQRYLNLMVVEASEQKTSLDERG